MKIKRSQLQVGNRFTQSNGDTVTIVMVLAHTVLLENQKGEKFSKSIEWWVQENLEPA